jgi:hypothetical protein
VAEGLRRAAALTAESVRERRIADMIGGVEGEILCGQAMAKWQRAARTRRLCWRLAATHDIRPKKTGAGGKARPVILVRAKSCTNTDERKVAHAL